VHPYTFDQGAPVTGLASYHRRLQLYGVLLLLPAAVLLTTFAYLPTVMTALNSLFIGGRGGDPAEYVGLENYAFLLSDDTFLQVAWNNTLYALATIPASVALALIMALLVDRYLPGRGLVRAAFFTPTVLPMIAAANVWLFFYAPDIGMLNRILGSLGVERINWLGSPDTALLSVIAVSIWKEAGFFMIFYLAALQSIPPDLREAASLEGTSRLRFFWRVTFPLLMPTTLFVLVNALINSVRVIDHLFILTKGGPNDASNLLLYHVYETAFSYFDRYYAATMTMAILVVLGIVAVVKFRFLDTRIHYQ